MWIIYGYDLFAPAQRPPRRSRSKIEQRIALGKHAFTQKNRSPCLICDSVAATRRLVWIVSNRAAFFLRHDERSPASHRDGQRVVAQRPRHPRATLSAALGAR